MATTWALNPLTWDIFINRDGKIQTTYGVEEVVQRIKVTLGHFYGEYFLAPQHGLPWYEFILGSRDYRMVEMLLRSAVLGVPGVLSIASMDISLPRAANDRSMTVSMQVEAVGQSGPKIIDIVYTLSQ